MSAHTPGPWTAKMQVSRDGDSLGWIIDHPNGRIGWSSYATAHPNQGEMAPYTQGGFNAHLIAAAPELLNACQAALNDRMYKDWPGIADLLIAVIAKAEGKP